MSYKNLFLVLFLATSVLANAQHYRKDEDAKPGSKPQKIGVRIGLASSWLKAPEMRKGTPQVGVQGAIYYRLGLSSRFHLNTELGACYRGANYSDDTGSYYSRLGLFYLELPVLAMFSLDKGQNHNLLVGPSFSYLVKPSLFIRTDYYPAFTELPIKKWEVAAAIGYMYSTKYVGLYVGYKHGLNNLAGDFANYEAKRDSGNETPAFFSEISPSLKNVKTLFNRSIEISLYF